MSPTASTIDRKQFLSFTLDYAEQWSMLEQSNNPFAIVVMAHLRAQSTRRYPQSRLRSKIELVKDLYARGYTRKQILELFRFRLFRRNKYPGQVTVTVYSPPVVRGLYRTVTVTLDPYFLE